MQFFTLATIAVLAAGNAFAWKNSSATNTCYTITEYNKPPCTTPSPCTVEDCIILSTITQSCGCATIPTTNICLTTCPLGCSTQYTALYPPCATSPSSPSSSSTYPTTIPSTSSSTYPTTTPSTSSSSPITSSSATAGPSYTNSTITVTAVTTLTTCPATCTCSGQKTTWTGSQGPYSCTKTPSCVAQLPGGEATTITGTIVVSKTGPQPTSSSSPASLQAGSGGERRNEVGAAGGLFAGLIGLLALF